MWRVALVVLAVSMFGLAGALYFRILTIPLGPMRSAAEAAVEIAPVGSRQSIPHRSEPPVRVTVAKVERATVPIFMPAIGTVQAYATINVKTRVDGEITKILFDEGQDVKAGDPLAIIDQRPYEATLHQWQAVWRKDKAQLESNILDLHRYQKLMQSQQVSQQQLDQQNALVAAGQAQVDSDKAQIDLAKVQLDFTTLRAPVTGRLGIRMVDQGNIIHSSDNTVVAVLTQLQPISVVFTAPSKAVAQAGLVLGKVHVPVDALAADNVTLLDHGTVDLVDNIVDQTTGTVKLKASFPNASYKLWPGDFVNGRLTIDTRENALTVPTAAVLHGPNGDYVWRLNGNIVEARNVGTKQSANGRTLVTRGLASGDLVVTDGYFLLENGRHVDAVLAGEPLSPGRTRAATEVP